MMRRVGQVIVAAAVVCATAVALDWTFWSRWWSIGEQDALSYPAWIKPSVIVDGGFSSALPRVDPDDVELSAEAIAELRAYAEELDSFSLLVHYGDGIQLEA